MAETLSVAVCLFPNVTSLDYQGPVELFGFLTPDRSQKYLPSNPTITFKLTYLSHTLDPIKPLSGPTLLPDLTYNSVITDGIQYDILLVPGGPEAQPDLVPPDLIDFLKRQIPKARYVLSICTGSWILAGTGFLDGKRATTNKASFTMCKKATSEKINWVAEARWVEDGKLWTSSGVTAGADMANAFLTHLVGDEIMTAVRGIVELSARKENQDEFAKYYGLV